MKTLSTLSAIILPLAFSAMAMAQPQQATQQQQRALIQQGDAQAFVNPNPGNQFYDNLLGFQGQFIYGFGMKILHVQRGSEAQRLGLESGDAIVAINHTRVNSQWQYRQLLQDALQYRNGYAALKVRNVRYDWGYHVPKFVTVHANLGRLGRPYPGYPSYPYPGGGHCGQH